MSHRPARIHIVDDDPSVARALKRLLSSWGMQARTFTSGKAFLADLSASQEIDCAVIDIRMPEMNGFELRAHMKHAGWHIPIIFITANEALEIEAEALQGGAVGFLRKPFSDQALVVLIRRTLGRTP
ncbi:MAG: response regulator [Desulfobacterales bacterium]|nr:response regulator [Desulfobacterales bacterium]